DIGSVSPETEPTHGGGAVPASCSGAPTTVKHRERTVGAACARRACVAGVVSITSITRVHHARDRPCRPRAHPPRATPALHAPTVAKDGLCALRPPLFATVELRTGSRWTRRVPRTPQHAARLIPRAPHA